MAQSRCGCKQSAICKQSAFFVAGGGSLVDAQWQQMLAMQCTDVETDGFAMDKSYDLTGRQHRTDESAISMTEWLA